MESIKTVLPKGSWQYWFWRSTPKRVRRLVYSSRKDPRDLLSVYTFLLKSESVFVFAIEIWVYESNSHTTVFIAKADTSGYAHRLNTRHLVAEILTNLCASLPPHKPIRIALSAKAQGQYLFAFSKENSKKHILDDGKLIKWWIETLSLVLPKLKFPVARLHIPGMSDHETQAYFPKGNHNQWASGDIYSQKDQWAVKCIPRFDDDPKTRFLQDIVTGKRAKRVLCDQFWLELADRQECNIGARIGFIGIEASGIQSIDSSPNQAESLGYEANTRLKQALMSGNYSSLTKAIESSKVLESHLPEGTEIEGEFVYNAVSTQKERPKVVVNTLQGLVRKKKV